MARVFVHLLICQTNSIQHDYAGAIMKHQVVTSPSGLVSSVTRRYPCCAMIKTALSYHNLEAASARIALYVVVAINQFTMIKIIIIGKYS